MNHDKSETSAKILYVTDLDGTLLNSKGFVSNESARIINELTKSGVEFAFATARSYFSMSAVTAGIKKKTPNIIYNGMFIVDAESGERLFDYGNYMRGECLAKAISVLEEHDISPLVYAQKESGEKVTWHSDKETTGMQRYFETRPNDIRLTPTKDRDELFGGDIFYLTCIQEHGREKFKAAYDKLVTVDGLTVMLQQDIYYSDDCWLEITPSSASKALAIDFLKEKLDCDRLVVFGDGINDMSMFKIADECYTTENAVDELKEIATGVIGKNDDDAVAKWILENHSKA